LYAVTGPFRGSHFAAWIGTELNASIGFQPAIKRRVFLTEPRGEFDATIAGHRQHQGAIRSTAKFALSNACHDRVHAVMTVQRPRRCNAGAVPWRVAERLHDHGT